MKRFSALFLCVLIMLSLCACGEKREYLTYYEMGLEVAENMGRITSSEEYLQLMGVPDEVMGIILSAGEGDHDDPDAVFRLDITPEDVLDEMGCDGDDLSAAAEEMLQKRMYGSLATIAGGQLVGNSWLAAVSVVSYSTVYPLKEKAEEAEMYLYCFDGYPILVTFVPGEGSVVTAGGCYLPMEFDCRDEDDVEDAFDEYLDISVHPEEVEE